MFKPLSLNVQSECLIYLQLIPQDPKLMTFSVQNVAMKDSGAGAEAARRPVQSQSRCSERDWGNQGKKAGPTGTAVPVRSDKADGVGNLNLAASRRLASLIPLPAPR